MITKLETALAKAQDPDFKSWNQINPGLFYTNRELALLAAKRHPQIFRETQVLWNREYENERNRKYNDGGNRWRWVFPWANDREIIEASLASGYAGNLYYYAAPEIRRDKDIALAFVRKLAIFPFSYQIIY